MKTVIITGASRGIGAQTARLFAQNGYGVVINYNKNRVAAEKLQAELRGDGLCAEIFGADVADAAQCKKLAEFAAEKFKKIDVLVNNAGIAQIKPFTDLTENDFDTMMGVNFKGVYNMCKAVAPYMISAQKGAIVNISSVWGESGSSCETIYCASKAAVSGFTKALAKELGPSQITVNCVAPGLIDTQMNGDLTEEVIKGIVDETPLMRIGKPSDVANAVLFLADERSSFITGQVLDCDGGWQV